MGIVMHAKTLRTTSLHKMCLILLTSLALIVSSVATSSSLMPFQMLNLNQANLPECNTTTQGLDAHTMHEALSESSHAEHITPTSHSPIDIDNDVIVNIDNDCPSDRVLQHDCCDTTCITVMATLLNDPVDNMRLGKTVTYPIDNSRDIIEISHSLYRPPNA